MNRRAGLVGAAIGLAMTAGACATAHRPAAKPTPAGGSPAAGVPTAGADPARIDPANFVRTVDNPWFPLVPGQSLRRDGGAEPGKGLSRALTWSREGIMAVAHSDNGRPVDIRVGDLQLRLAETAAEIEAAQALRYHIFYEEMSAKPIELHPVP